MCEFEKRLQELKQNSFYGINDKDENSNTHLAAMFSNYPIISLYAPSEKQAEQLSDRIMADGYKLLNENKFIGESELKSLRYKAAKGEVDKVYIYSFEVLAKKFKDQVTVLRELWASGVEIIFLSKGVQIE